MATKRTYVILTIKTKYKIIKKLENDDNAVAAAKLARINGVCVHLRSQTLKNKTKIANKSNEDMPTHAEAFEEFERGL
ncbi:hypothetical protein M0802_000065 [Mischocyttarus mexicanus]|nr:hypothetical protein M0802_000065 [Mischocyttarus mexicanus]